MINIKNKKYYLRKIKIIVVHINIVEPSKIVNPGKLNSNPTNLAVYYGVINPLNSKNEGKRMIW